MTAKSTPLRVTIEDLSQLGRQRSDMQRNGMPECGGKFTILQSFIYLEFRNRNSHGGFAVQ